MATGVKEKVDSWLSNPSIDEQTKEAIRAMSDAEKDDAFYKDLEFGTGGMRGVMGIGTNRINQYTLGFATQGLSNYLLKSFPDEPIKVAIAYDCRHNSKDFAEVVASVFSANGIEVYIYEDLRPTPLLSFTIRELGCKSGVVLTASHNPPEYNGYKAYWDDGAQVTPPHDKNIIEEVQKIKGADEVKFEKNSELIHWIGEDIDTLYLDQVVNQSLAPELIRKHRNIPIVFSPIHGTSYKLVPAALEKLGFTQVHTIEEQMIPDGNFPTVVSPNPEEPEALNMAIQKARSIDAELVMACDPDGDRVGIAVKDLKGDYVLLNGNQTGAIIFDYMLRKNKERANLGIDKFVVKTIVSSNLLNDICAHYEIECFDTLTGFKNIATIIRNLEGKKKYLVGGEESYGYLIGDFVRDKDAVTSCVILAEIAAAVKEEGLSIFEKLVEIYSRVGFYKESLISVVKKGKKGAEEIAQIMERLRKDPIDEIGGSKVVKVIDYQEQVAYDKVDQTQSKVELDRSNVLQFITEEGTKISARPSGTEPKIKFYISTKLPFDDPKDFETANAQMDQKLEDLKQEFLERVG
ncbi:MAG: phospho-sugar mutase [Cyclobacteriaceae bacterium]|nr:phospho-sugar mutase [Cyclobacteriaceae bacterium]MCH8516403.1 phospho-sugar mutase [Cyclobacteriaceae bacterium]